MSTGTNTIYFADFENPPYSEGKKPKDWYAPSYWYIEGLEGNENGEGHDIDSFFAYVKDINDNAHSRIIIYFHNLRYDGNFLTQWLNNNNVQYEDFINERGDIYSLTIGNIEFRCSYKLLLNSVKNLGKMVSEEKGIEFKKGDYDYNKIKHWDNVDDIPQDLKDYCIRDVQIVKNAFIILAPHLMMDGKLPLTLGQKSFWDMRQVIGQGKFFLFFRNQWWPKHIDEPPFEWKKTKKGFPYKKYYIEEGWYETKKGEMEKRCITTSDEKPEWFDEWYGGILNFRKNYRGGITLANPKYQCKIIEGNIKKYDINSSYPASMMVPLPFGELLLKKPNCCSTRFINITIYNIKKIKKDAPACFWVNDKDFQTSNPYTNEKEPWLWGELKNVKLNYIILYEEFELLKKIYKIDYIVNENYYYKSYRYALKYVNKYRTMKMESKGAKRMFAKLMLNSAYGKFGQNKILVGHKHLKLCEEDGIKYQKFSEPEYTYSVNDTTYLPCAMAITGKSRVRLIKNCLKAGDKWIYMDTDSIISIGEIEGLDLDENEFGAWKDETKDVAIKKFYVATNKQYAYIDENGEMTLKIKGINDRTGITWENFTNPENDLYGYNLQMCHQYGWVCLKKIKKLIWAGTNSKKLSLRELGRELNG